MSIHRFAAVLSCAAAGMAMMFAARADAAVVQYTIDPTQSSLTITGTFGGDTGPTQQTSGSLTTSYSGFIDADRQASSIQILISSRMNAALQGSDQAPAPDGESTSDAPADYGRQGDVTFVSSQIPGVEAFRDVLLDIDSAVEPISANSFDSDFGLGFQTGTADWAFGGTAFGQEEFAGLGTSSTSATDSTVEIIGGVERLTLRINTGPITYTGAGTENSSVGFTGTIVATRAIPEPTSLAALAAGAGLLLARRRRGA
jgi:hypothetical protein